MEDGDPPNEGLQSYVLPDGRTVMADAEARAFLEDKDRPRPLQVHLDSVWARTARATLIEGGATAGKALGTTVLLEVTDQADLQALRDLTAIDESDVGFHCMCYGDLALVLKAASDTDLLVLGVHHGVSVRWDGWDSDAGLVRGQVLLEWLAARGVAEPLRRFLDDEQRSREYAASFESWLMAIPEALAYLRPRMEALRQSGGSLDANTRYEAQDKLSEAYPSPLERVAVLLRWLASGSGRTSGYPSYEGIPQQFLLDVPIADLVLALDRSDPDVLDGGVRLMAGWDFQHNRGDDLLAVPLAMRRKLLSRALSSGDEDKIRRARLAFGAEGDLAE